MSRRRFSVLESLGLGAAIAVPLLFVERSLWPDALRSDRVRLDDWSSVLASLFLFAPLQEGAELVAAWLPSRKAPPRGRLSGVRMATAAAAGFALVRLPFFALSGPHHAANWARTALLLPAQLFCAAMWGYARTGVSPPAHGARARRARPFIATFGAATLLHGLYDHLVLSRETAALLGSGPLLLGMALVTWAAARDFAEIAGERGVLRGPLLRTLPPPPSLKTVRKALRRAERPIMLRWAFLGALVTTGLMITTIALTIVVARRAGVDFSTVDEGDAPSLLPLALLGGAGLVSFPISGYLVARASASEGVLESALSAGLCIVGVLVSLGIASPVALVFSLAVAPIAFALACTGAWLALGAGS